MREMFEMSRLLPNSIRNNEEYHESAWDTRGMIYKEDITHKATKDGLPTEMKEEVIEQFGRKYLTIPTEEWIYLIWNLEARDDRCHAAREYQKPAAKNKRSEKPDEDDSNSEFIHKVPHNKRKHKHGKGKKQKTAINTVTQCYFVL